MRCLALAQAWVDTGGRALFISAKSSSSLERRLQNDGFETVRLSVEPGGLEDAKATSFEAQHRGSRLVVVDGYHFRSEFSRYLRKAALRVISIDDNGSENTDASDLIINQNRHATPALYMQHAPETRLLLGTNYALLRREFRCLTVSRDDFQANATRLLVTLGAADPENVTTRVIDVLAAKLEPRTETRIVVGGSNRHAATVAAATQHLTGGRLIDEPGSSMPELMAWADFAVSAGGSTMWELAYLGVPFIPIVIAENQRSVTLALERDGYLAVDSTALERDLPHVVQTLTRDAGKRRELGQIGRHLVDGLGTQRVCQVLRDMDG